MKVVGCFLEYKGKFVILYRHSHKPDGDTWGLPSGKVEAGEDVATAAIRELYEETGYQARPEELEHLGDFEFVSSSGKPYTYSTYRVVLQRQHQLQLETAAHAKYQWVTAAECNARHDLIPGFHELLQKVGAV